MGTFILSSVTTGTTTSELRCKSTMATCSWTTAGAGDPTLMAHTERVATGTRYTAIMSPPTGCSRSTTGSIPSHGTATTVETTSISAKLPGMRPTAPSRIGRSQRVRKTPGVIGLLQTGTPSSLAATMWTTQSHTSSEPQLAPTAWRAVAVLPGVVVRPLWHWTHTFRCRTHQTCSSSGSLAGRIVVVVSNTA